MLYSTAVDLDHSDDDGSYPYMGGHEWSETNIFYIEWITSNYITITFVQLTLIGIYEYFIVIILYDVTNVFDNDTSAIMSSIDYDVTNV